MDRSSQMHGNLINDVKQLMVLNAELETAVEVLKGEIWTLNEQLKGVKFSLTKRQRSRLSQYAKHTKNSKR